MRRSLFLLVAVAIAVGNYAQGALDDASAPKAATPGAADEPHRSTEVLKKELAKIIEGQLAAFRADDFRKAFTFASEEIRGSISVEQFEEMVKTGYPVIAKSSRSEFGLAFDAGDEAVVNVQIEGGEKKTVGYQYHLVKQKGGWKISGVSEIKIEGLAV